MKLEDLPPAMQAQVREKAGMPEPQRKDRTGASRTTTDGYCQCGEHFTSTTKWERHSDASGAGHRRFELIRPEVKA